MATARETQPRMTFRKALLLAIAIVVPLSILLWLMFLPILFYALYPGLVVQMLITAAGHGTPTESLLGLFAGALLNVAVYSLLFYGVARLRTVLTRGGTPSN